MPATDEAVQTALAADSLRNVAIAVPLFGTTLSHYSVLCDHMGFEPLQAWHRSLQERGIREARGNGAVKDLVAEGACSLGFTDTDDVFAALDAGKPVAMRPVRLDSGQTICLPNSVAMIHNCPHPENAVTFIRYLLSPEVELALAQSASRQIPLGPVDAAQLPEEVRPIDGMGGRRCVSRGRSKAGSEGNGMAFEGIHGALMESILSVRLSLVRPDGNRLA